LLDMPRMIRRRFFRPDVELALKAFIGALAIGAFLVTFAWGYEQRRQAQEWRQTACAWRAADLARTAPLVARDLDARSACGRLAALGVSVQTSSAPVTD
jgi:hypothetical protein